jgi:Cu+-exporting ATPase
MTTTQAKSDTRHQRERLKRQPKTDQIELLIEGAGCASCVSKIENALQQVQGVNSATMNFAQRSVSVDGNAAIEAMLRSVEKAGYHATAQVLDAELDQLDAREQADHAHYQRLLKHMALALGLGAALMLYPLLGGAMTVENRSQQLAWLLVGLLCAGVMITAGRHFYVGAWHSLRNRHATMDTLIALGTGTAWLYSMIVVLFPHIVPDNARHLYFEASAMIIGLINLGLALELRARGRTGQAIKRLIGMQPKTARIIRNGVELDIAIEQVATSDRVRVRPGESIPVDGVVLEGHSTVDESMLTGEPIATRKTAGDEVAAGTLNKNGAIIFEATRVGADTALARIIAMVKQAQNTKPAIGRLADRIAAVFVPTVIIIAVLSAVLWLLLGPDPGLNYAIVAATSVLIIACPCALGLATPMSVMVGVGKAAEAGVLIRNGEALQSAANLTTIVLDKTGTITQGEPAVTALQTMKPWDENQVLLLAASLEAASEHPLAQAIVDNATIRELSLAPVHHFAAIAGHGVCGEVMDKQLLLGNRRLMEQHDVALSTAQLQRARQMAERAQTPVYLAVDGQLAGIIAIADPLKTDSAAAIARLQQRGLKLVMITGDNNATAQAVAKQVGITDYRADVLPEGKAEQVAALQQRGEIVAMVGDGINDAPALACANVGFAIGSGTDIAIESADITLMRGSLHGLADAIAISGATLRNIKQNLFGAFIYNTLGIPIAAGILYPFIGLQLNPVIAGAAMAFSSVTVVSNANRLRWFKPSEH